MLSALTRTAPCLRASLVRQYTMSSATVSIAAEMLSSKVSRAAIYTNDQGDLVGTHEFLTPLVEQLTGPGGADYDKHDAL